MDRRKLRNEIGKLVYDIRSIHERARAEKRELNSEELSELERLQSRVDELEARLSALEVSMNESSDEESSDEPVPEEDYEEPVELAEDFPEEENEDEQENKRKGKRSNRSFRLTHRPLLSSTSITQQPKHYN